MKFVIIHTDGGCEGNPGPGGYAAVLRFGDRTREISGGVPATTNNRMELQAALSALQTLKEPCSVALYTDSIYLRNGISIWVAQWKAKGWKQSQKKPVKNDDLWRALDAEAARHKVEWHWVRGHAGNPDNERCDQLAQLEIGKIKHACSAADLEKFRDEFIASRQAVAVEPGLF